MDADTKEEANTPRVGNQRSELADLMPDTDADEPTVEVQALVIEDDAAANESESFGFDPYDTGVLQK